MNTFQDKPPI